MGGDLAAGADLGMRAYVRVSAYRDEGLDCRGGVDVCAGEDGGVWADCDEVRYASW